MVWAVDGGVSHGLVGVMPGLGITFGIHIGQGEQRMAVAGHGHCQGGAQCRPAGGAVVEGDQHTGFGQCLIAHPAGAGG